MQPSRGHLRSFVDAASEELDISSEQALAVEERYHHLGSWLLDNDPSRVDVSIYPQGSFRLGTVVKPGIGGGDIDIDLVYLRDLKYGSITQTALKAEAGELLEKYCAEVGIDAPIELGRCWRIDFFEEGFHLDVLPCIPDESTDQGIRLSDRDLQHWQFSNPTGYATWFYARMNQVLVDENRALVASALGREIADVPEFLIRTPLQRAVQALKRSRDTYFGDDPRATPSILITTLTAHLYSGEQDVAEAVIDIVRRLHEPIELRDGVWWLANPAHAEENFADKWNTDPARRTKFLTWQAALLEAVEGAQSVESLDLAVDRLSGQFGDISTAAKDAIVASARGSLGDRSSGRMKALHEMFPEDLWELRDDCTVEVRFDVARGGGEYTSRRALGQRRLYKQGQVRFTLISSTVPPPYEIYWKVRNFGRQAGFLKQLRGEIIRGEAVHLEGTRYQGEQYIDCYVVKDGVRRACKRTWVPIM